MKFYHYSSEAIYSDCRRYMITASYTFHGPMRGTKPRDRRPWFHCWFGEPVTFDECGIIRSSHLKPLGDIYRTQDEAEAVCARHRQQLQEHPAENTEQRSSGSAPDVRAAD